MNRYWPPEEEILLRALWSEGVSQNECAIRLRRSKSSIKARIAHLGLERRHARAKEQERRYAKPCELTLVSGGPLRVSDIREAVKSYYGIRRSELMGRSIQVRVARPRILAMALAYWMTDASLPAVGIFFGRDHTTVLSATRSVTTRMLKDPHFREEVRTIRAAISAIKPTTAKPKMSAATLQCLIQEEIAA